MECQRVNYSHQNFNKNEEFKRKGNLKRKLENLSSDSDRILNVNRKFCSSLLDDATRNVNTLMERLCKPVSVVLERLSTSSFKTQGCTLTDSSTNKESSCHPKNRLANKRKLPMLHESKPPKLLKMSKKKTQLPQNMRKPFKFQNVKILLTRIEDSNDTDILTWKSKQKLNSQYSNDYINLKETNLVPSTKSLNTKDDRKTNRPDIRIYLHPCDNIKYSDRQQEVKDVSYNPKHTIHVISRSLKHNSNKAVNNILIPIQNATPKSLNTTKNLVARESHKENLVDEIHKNKVSNVDPNSDCNYNDDLDIEILDTSPKKNDSASIISTSSGRKVSMAVGENNVVDMKDICKNNSDNDIQNKNNNCELESNISRSSHKTLKCKKYNFKSTFPWQYTRKNKTDQNIDKMKMHLKNKKSISSCQLSISEVKNVHSKTSFGNINSDEKSNKKYMKNIETIDKSKTIIEENENSQINRINSIYVHSTTKNDKINKLDNDNQQINKIKNCDADKSKNNTNSNNINENTNASDLDQINRNKCNIDKSKNNTDANSISENVKPVTEKNKAVTDLDKIEKNKNNKIHQNTNDNNKNSSICSEKVNKDLVNNENSVMEQNTSQKNKESIIDNSPVTDLCEEENTNEDNANRKLNQTQNIEPNSTKSANTEVPDTSVSCNKSSTGKTTQKDISPLPTKLNDTIEKTVLNNSQVVKLTSIAICKCHVAEFSLVKKNTHCFEMVLFCRICQIFYPSLECFEIHYRNQVCSQDRNFSRLPKLFCSSCLIILNSISEIRYHFEMHLKLDKKNNVTFICNICKIVFLGFGQLFYKHWLTHMRDRFFICSQFSFPKLSIIDRNHKEIVNHAITSILKRRKGYYLVAEYVCKNCKSFFLAKNNIEKHILNGCVNKEDLLALNMNDILQIENDTLHENTTLFLSKNLNENLNNETDSTKKEKLLKEKCTNFAMVQSSNGNNSSKLGTKNLTSSSAMEEENNTLNETISEKTKKINSGKKCLDDIQIISENIAISSINNEDSNKRSQLNLVDNKDKSELHESSVEKSTNLNAASNFSPKHNIIGNKDESESRESSTKNSTYLQRGTSAKYVTNDQNKDAHSSYSSNTALNSSSERGFLRVRNIAELMDSKKKPDLLLKPVVLFNKNSNISTDRNAVLPVTTSLGSNYRTSSNNINRQSMNNINVNASLPVLSTVSCSSQQYPINVPNNYQQSSNNMFGPNFIPTIPNNNINHQQNMNFNAAQNQSLNAVGNLNHRNFTTSHTNVSLLHQTISRCSESNNFDGQGLTANYNAETAIQNNLKVVTISPMQYKTMFLNSHYFICPYCQDNSKYYSKEISLLSSHIETQHNICYLCKYKAKNANDLIKHKRLQQH